MVNIRNYLYEREKIKRCGSDECSHMLVAEVFRDYTKYEYYCLACRKQVVFDAWESSIIRLLFQDPKSDDDIKSYLDKLNKEIEALYYIDHLTPDFKISYLAGYLFNFACEGFKSPQSEKRCKSMVGDSFICYYEDEVDNVSQAINKSNIESVSREICCSHYLTVEFNLWNSPQSENIYYCLECGEPLTNLDGSLSNYSVKVDIDRADDIPKCLDKLKEEYERVSPLNPTLPRAYLTHYLTNYLASYIFEGGLRGGRK